MPDGTTTTADATLGNGKEGTPKTYTEDQARKMVTDAKSSVLADARRFQVEAEKSLRAAQAAQERLGKLEQARIDAELEANKDDPAEIRRIRAEQKAQQAEANLVERERELAEHKERLSKLESEHKDAALSQRVRDIAVKAGVDPEKLIKYAKATDGSLEAIEEIAKDLPKVSPAHPDLKPDSNRGIGGGLSDKQIGDDFIKDPYNPLYKQRYQEMVARRGY